MKGGVWSSPCNWGVVVLGMGSGPGTFDKEEVAVTGRITWMTTSMCLS